MLLLAAAVTAAGISPVAVDAATQIDEAFQACERWILEPSTHTGRIEDFPRLAGLGGKLEPQADLPDVALPPPSYRIANHSWRVPIGGGGVFVTVSDTVPMCHIAAGGPFDLEPSIEREIKSASFLHRWKETGSNSHQDMLTKSYVSNESSKFSMIVSLARKPGERTDRVQLLATAQFDTGN